MTYVTETAVEPIGVWGQCGPDRDAWVISSGCADAVGKRRSTRSGPPVPPSGGLSVTTLSGRIDPGRHGSERLLVRASIRAARPAGMYESPDCSSTDHCPRGRIPTVASANRDLPRPSRSEAPARFGTVAYSQWYAQEASVIRHGWNRKQFVALKKLWFRESSWNYKAVNRSSGFGESRSRCRLRRCAATAGLPHQPGDPDRLGPGLHQGPLWLAGQGDGVSGSATTGTDHRSHVCQLTIRHAGHRASRPHLHQHLRRRNAMTSSRIRATVAGAISIPLILGTVAVPATASAPTTAAVKATSVAAKKTAPTAAVAWQGTSPLRHGEVQPVVREELHAIPLRLGQKQRRSLVNLWNRESGWSQHAHNGSSGAHGSRRPCPAEDGHSRQELAQNPETQIRWGSFLHQGRYGTPTAPGRRSSLQGLVLIDLFPRPPCYVRGLAFWRITRPRWFRFSPVRRCCRVVLQRLRRTLPDSCPTTCERPGESRRPSSFRTSPVGVFTASGHSSVGGSPDRDPGGDRAHGLGEEVVALVVDDHERREVLHLDAPDRLHAVFGGPAPLPCGCSPGQTRGRAHRSTRR